MVSLRRARAAVDVGFGLVGALMLSSCADEAPLRLRIRLENVSDAAGYVVGSTPVETGLSPGLLVLVDEVGPLFRVGEPEPGLGLEALAEQGAPFTLFDELAARGYAPTLFELADVTYAEGGIHPGESYTLEVEAARGARLHLATMFGESNDWLVATPEAGIAVRDLDVGESRDVSAELVVVDVGTEADEAPFEGPNQGPRQTTPTSGTDESVAVSLVTDTAIVPASRAARLVVERLR